ncbi:MAG TPA: flagellar biosynthesis anti-sigma factor FlgM [Bryobacteraceae bacterium]|jgi:anti-sigma28 factor (negative regulator of flagellin synthesis)
MRVNERNLTGSAAPESGRTQEAQQVGRESGLRSGNRVDTGGDRVEFSSALGRLSRAMSAFQADRASRVEALAAQYQSGRYRADSGATARGMVAEALGAAGMR